jgi:tRNA-uridine 2-sulfurtransferase
LGVGGPAADGRPRYVTDIDAETGTVTVGSADRLRVWTIEARHPVWTRGVAPDGPVDCVVQVRAHGGTAAAVAEAVAGGGLSIRLREPLTGVARGQAAVLYLPDPRGDRVLGSGTISRTDSRQPADAY